VKRLNLALHSGRADQSGPQMATKQTPSAGTASLSASKTPVNPSGATDAKPTYVVNPVPRGSPSAYLTESSSGPRKPARWRPTRSSVSWTGSLASAPRRRTAAATAQRPSEPRIAVHLEPLVACSKGDHTARRRRCRRVIQRTPVRVVELLNQASVGYAMRCK
jgi:hypothetical protein